MWPLFRPQALESGTRINNSICRRQSPANVSTAVGSLSMQKVVSNMMTFVLPEVFKQREKIMNDAFQDRIRVLEREPRIDNIGKNILNSNIMQPYFFFKK